MCVHNATMIRNFSLGAWQPTPLWEIAYHCVIFQVTMQNWSVRLGIGICFLTKSNHLWFKCSLSLSPPRPRMPIMWSILFPPWEGDSGPGEDGRSPEEGRWAGEQRERVFHHPYLHQPHPHDHQLSHYGGLAAPCGEQRRVPTHPAKQNMLLWRECLLDQCCSGMKFR